MPVREVQHRKDSRLFAQLCSTLLRKGHSVQFSVHGESMRPNILDGDSVLVAPTATRDLRQGDIALVENPDGLRLHRVASFPSSGTVITRSDSAIDSDPSASHVFGKVVVLQQSSGKQSLTPLRTRFVHPVRTMLHRLRSATILRLRRAAFFLSGLLALSLLCATFLAPGAHSQTADLQLTQAAPATAVAAGTTFTYTEVVKNNTSTATVATGTITVYMQTPPNTTYQSNAGANWACTNGTGGALAANYIGPLICTYNNTLASGATASTLTFTMLVNAGTASGTTIQSSATVTNSTDQDTVPSNNTSLTSIIIEPTTTSDLSVSMSVAPTPVFIFSNFTYTITIRNLGQATAPITMNVLTDTLPTGVTFVSSTPSAGWSCSGSHRLLQYHRRHGHGFHSHHHHHRHRSFQCHHPHQHRYRLLSPAIQTPPTTPPPPTPSFSRWPAPLLVAMALPGALSGIVNAYYPPSSHGTLASASTSVALGAAAGGCTKSHRCR